MREFLHRIEPVIWLLFGMGILVGTMLLTGWILVVGIAIPIGVVPAEALSYERALRLGGHPIGRLVLLGLIALPLWKGAFHVRHLVIDFRMGHLDGIVAPLLYGLAALGSLIGIVAVLSL